MGKPNVSLEFVVQACTLTPRLRRHGPSPSSRFSFTPVVTVAHRARHALAHRDHRLRASEAHGIRGSKRNCRSVDDRLHGLVGAGERRGPPRTRSHGVADRHSRSPGSISARVTPSVGSSTRCPPDAADGRLDRSTLSASRAAARVHRDPAQARGPRALRPGPAPPARRPTPVSAVRRR